MGLDKLVVSVSGGRSSMYMAYRLHREYGNRFDLLFVFANTGQEREETLIFVDNFTREFGIPITWVEAVTVPGKGNGTRHKVVDFYTASRDGQPFEDSIKKYGIPNISRPKCTDELKIVPIKAYLRSLGEGWNKADQAIGIRADEPKRYAKRKPKIIYPLVDIFPVSKADVLAWWAKQKFDLQLLEHEGNCSWCYKKSLSKLKKLMQENKSIFDFPERMEKENGLVRSNDGKPFRFFRGNRTVQDIRNMANDDTELLIDDMSSECGESCEAI